MNIEWITNDANIDNGMEFLMLALGGSTLVLGSVWLFNQAFRSISSALRFSLWQGAFVGLMFLPCILVLFPTIPLVCLSWLACWRSQEISTQEPTWHIRRISARS